VGDSSDTRGAKPNVTIPLRHNYQTELKFEVKRGGNTANFDLTSNK